MASSSVSSTVAPSAGPRHHRPVPPAGRTRATAGSQGGHARAHLARRIAHRLEFVAQFPARAGRIISAPASGGVATGLRSSGAARPVPARLRPPHRGRADVERRAVLRKCRISGSSGTCRRVAALTRHFGRAGRRRPPRAGLVFGSRLPSNRRSRQRASRTPDRPAPHRHLLGIIEVQPACETDATAPSLSPFRLLQIVLRSRSKHHQSMSRRGEWLGGNRTHDTTIFRASERLGWLLVAGALVKSGCGGCPWFQGLWCLLGDGMRGRHPMARQDVTAAPCASPVKRAPSSLALFHSSLTSGEPFSWSRLPANRA